MVFLAAPESDGRFNPGAFAYQNDVFLCPWRFFVRKTIQGASKKSQIPGNRKKCRENGFLKGIQQRKSQRDVFENPDSAMTSFGVEFYPRPNKIRKLVFLYIKIV